MGREMKDSGVEWVGKIPNNWSFIKSKYIFSQKNKRGNKDNLQLLTPSQKYGVIPQTLYEELSGMVAVKLKEDTNFSLLKTIHNGDFCISLRSFQGGFEYCKYEGVVSPAYQVFSADIPVCNDYYKYLFKDKSFIEKINSYTLSLRDGKNIAFSDFGYTEIPVPPLKEQLLIANFLDKECSEIDNLTADIEKQISLLEDYKKSIITESVTKGLNPNVELKDSGVEWIGDIPKHWTVHPIYCYFSERKNKNFSMKEHNLLSLSYGKIIKKDINALGGLLPASFNTYNIVERDDIIIRPTDLQNDKKSLRTGLVQEKGIITSAYLDLKPNKNVYSKFFHYLLHSYDVIKVFYNMGNGVRQGLTYGVFSSLKVIEPPLSEQQNIANYLDKKCSEIDSLISEKKEQLENLSSYKQSMIYEYVTGKKEVPTQEIA